MKKEKKEIKKNKIPVVGSMIRPNSPAEGLKYLMEERIARNTKLKQVVVFETDEWTSVCPRTGQPDFGRVKISFSPDKYIIESKALKFYLWSFRDEGAFCEELSAMIATDIEKAIKPIGACVEVFQNKRGGLELYCKTIIGKFDE